jgi:hypothetical protein
MTAHDDELNILKATGPTGKQKPDPGVLEVARAIARQMACDEYEKSKQQKRGR